MSVSVSCEKKVIMYENLVFNVHNCINPIITHFLQENPSEEDAAIVDKILSSRVIKKEVGDRIDLVIESRQVVSTAHNTHCTCFRLHLGCWLRWKNFTSSTKISKYSS